MKIRKIKKNAMFFLTGVYSYSFHLVPFLHCVAFVVSVGCSDYLVRKAFLEWFWVAERGFSGAFRD